jgi:acyl-CoA synthetase (NDP forming)
MLEHGGFDAIAETWEGLRARFPDVPVFLSMLSTPALRARLEALHIPVFDEPGRMVHAIAALARFAPPLADGRPSPQPAVLTGEALSEAAASRILAAAGVPMLPHRIAGSAADAVEVAEALGMPVVLKIVSADIAHKTEIDGVKLHLGYAEAVAQAYHAIHARAAQHAPLGPAEARAMVAELRGAAILDGVEVNPLLARPAGEDHGPAAMRALMGRTVTGRIVLDPGG